ncbi:MAG TPA: diguanylate cyclase [Trichocoleus sp.]
MLPSLPLDPLDSCQSQAPLLLVADDEFLLRQLIRRAMEVDGYQVVEASSGTQCLELCQQNLPDLILLDALMPGMNGFDCCSQLKRAFGERCPPVFMITKLDDPESVDRAFAAGATDYITKPIHWPVFRQRVRQVLQNKHTIAQLKQQWNQERLRVQNLQFFQQELQRANLLLHHLAMSDELTHLANARAVDLYLHQQWEQLIRDQSPLSLILADIDNFEQYNDTFGQQAGNACLVKIASALTQEIKRYSDLVARYEGEKFAVILPHTDLAGARQVAQQLQARVRVLAITTSKEVVSSPTEIITLSFGVSCLRPEPNRSPQELVAAAKQALYAAKVQGCDRIVAVEAEVTVS